MESEIGMEVRFTGPRGQLDPSPRLIIFSFFFCSVSHIPSVSVTSFVWRERERARRGGMEKWLSFKICPRSRPPCRLVYLPSLSLLSSSTWRRGENIILKINTRLVLLWRNLTGTLSISIIKKNRKNMKVNKSALFRAAGNSFFASSILFYSLSSILHLRSSKLMSNKACRTR